MSFLTSVRPMPRPPSERAIVRLPWANSSKTWGRSSGVMPIPVSRIAMAIWLPTRRAETVIRPPSLVYLAAFVRMFTSTCSSRNGSASTRNPLLSIVRFSSCFRCSSSGRTVLDRARDHGRKVHQLLAQRDPAAGDAADLEQVVDQPREVLDLAEHDVPGPFDILLYLARPKSCAAPLMAERGLRSCLAPGAWRGTRPCASPLRGARPLRVSGW